MRTNKSLLKPIFIVCIVALLILCAITIKNTIIYSKYVSVDAVVIKTESVYGTHSDSNMNQKHLVISEYQVGDAKYVAEQQVFFKSNKNVGDIITVKYNPKNPAEISNTYSYNFMIFIIIFLGLFTSLLWIIIREKRD